MNILGCHLAQTCSSCPEQYDVYLGDKQIGYIRLRHGYFAACYPVVGGSCVYSSSEFSGDGDFELDAERLTHLWRAVACLVARHGEMPNREIPEVKVRQWANCYWKGSELEVLAGYDTEADAMAGVETDYDHCGTVPIDVYPPEKSDEG